MILNFDNCLDLVYLFFMMIGILPVFLYGEIHYRLSWFRGFLFKKEAEVLFDMPTRITAGTLPVMLMVKDSNKFPVHFERVEITVLRNGRQVKKEAIKFNKSLAQLFFSKIFPIDISDFANQKLQVRCEIFLQDGVRTRKITNHNLSGKYNPLFQVYYDEKEVPVASQWLRGDLHVHSNYTEDQVEFGAELSAYRVMGKARGLDFTGVVDHAYDLENVPGTWDFKDDNFTKWKNFKKEAGKLNAADDSFTLLPGYELSVDNGLGENVHLVVLNNQEIFAGNGDAMKKYKSYASEHYYRKILDELDDNALAYAAHPKTPQKFLHRKILKRGEWNSKDFVKELAGFQIINGRKGDGYKRGKKLWIRKILTGKRHHIYAGTDAHGNFNYNLAIKYPLLSMEMNDNHVFGEYFNYVKSEPGVDNIITNIRDGRIIVSDGPFLNLEIRQNQKVFGIGDEVDFLPGEISISGASNDFFGPIKFIRLIVGNCQSKREQSLELHDIDKYDYQRDLGIKLHDFDCYIRAELKTDKDKTALTNPIWLK